MRPPPTAPTPFDPAAAGWERLDSTGFIDLVGPFWLRRDAGHARYGFVAEPRHANLIGVVQGGMLMTFADRVLGLAAIELAHGAPCVTVQFETQFIAPTRIGAFVEIRPEVTARAGSLVFLRGLMTDGTHPVAAATGVWKLLRQRG